MINIERRKEYNRLWQQKHRKTDAFKTWREANRPRKAEQARLLNLKYRNAVLDHYGRQCACCGESFNEFLTIDHINGENKNEKYRCGFQLYTWLVKNNFPEGFQTLCMNCNFALGKVGYCPHKKVI